MGWITGAVENLMSTNEANKAAAAQRKIAESNLRDVWTCDVRYMRAQMLTSCIMRVVGRHICDHTDRDLRGKVCRDLLELFHASGVEVITDHDRAKADLPARDGKGWTQEELRALEWQRFEAMMRPIQMMVPCDEMRASQLAPGHVIRTTKQP